NRDISGGSLELHGLSTAIHFTAQMLLIDVAGLKRQTAEDFAYASARVDVHGRGCRQREINVSRARFQSHIAYDSIRNRSVYRAAGHFADEFPCDPLQTEISTAGSDFSVPRKITDFDSPARGFGVQSARSICYGNVAAARFDLDRTATILDFDRATARVRGQCSL